jgi:hypothetical protein
VFEAFSRLSDWHLVVGGTLAENIPPGAQVLQRYPGFLDQDTCNLLYSAADLVVISFHPGFTRDSGALRDAITWSVPVVCSDQSLPADVVREYSLGTVFESGDPASLASAVLAAPTEIDPANLARARTERSSRAAAAKALDAVGVFHQAPSTPQ